MACSLLLPWGIATVAQWVFVVRGLRELSAESPSEQRFATFHVITLGAMPPTIIFVVSAFVLMQAAPTVQFNADNSFAMSLWSFWVRAWESLFGCAGLQSICYLVWGGVSLVTGHRPWMRGVVLCGLFSSLCGWLLLRFAYPTA
jgi:hypothetical protein